MESDKKLISIAVYFEALDDASHQPDGLVLAFGYLGDLAKA